MENNDPSVIEILKRSPAKVNLRLEILGKRSDGYHELRMFNQKVTLFDEVWIRIGGRGIRVSTDSDLVPDGEENLVYISAKKILKKEKKDIGVEIRIKKKIPVSAGLGGGSSNAAETIKGLNDLLNLRLSEKELMEIGIEVGADVPFFIYRGASAIVEGIGEKIKEVKDSPRIWYLLVNPGFPVSTKWAFNNVNLQLTKKLNNINIHNLENDFKKLCCILKNDLEEVTIERYPIIREIKENLISLGAGNALMSGSGPTVFGLFSDEGKSKSAYKKIISKKEWAVFLAENL